MEWTPDLSVGVSEIDEQHRELFSRINDLVLAIRQSVCKYRIGDVIRFLEDYVVSHFGMEEELMDRLRYPEFTSHKAQHAHFIRQFSILKDELIKLDGGKKRGSYELSVTTNQIVVDWIIAHVKHTDRQLGEFLKTR